MNKQALPRPGPEMGHQGAGWQRIEEVAGAVTVARDGTESRGRVTGIRPVRVTGHGSRHGSVVADQRNGSRPSRVTGTGHGSRVTGHESRVTGDGSRSGSRVAVDERRQLTWPG